MSCLPLFSFSPSIPAAFKSNDEQYIWDPYENRSSTPIMSPEPIETPEDLYDKLSQVSAVSHRRADSFEWVMTQSLPGTPIASLSSNRKVFSPPPIRSISSAPLPVPNETWSTNTGTRQKRGYFDWWPSPSLGSSSKGYQRVSTSEAEEEDSLIQSPVTSSGRESISGLSRPLMSQRTESSTSSSSFGSQILPSQELNALGIVFPPTPPSTPPTSSNSNAFHSPSTPSPPSTPPAPSPAKPTSSTPRSSYSPIPSPQQNTPTPRLPKRVTFSPVIDSVTLDSFPSFSSTPPSTPPSWGAYLPSSFLVARPPLTRTTSSPIVARRTTAPRPILKRTVSTPNHHHVDDEESWPSTEMTRLVPGSKDKDTDIDRDAVDVASPIPAQRLSSAAARDGGRRVIEGGCGEGDKEFVAVLQGVRKTGRGRARCDSVLGEEEGECSSA